jgi:chromosome segregation ATPase
MSEENTSSLEQQEREKSRISPEALGDAIVRFTEELRKLLPYPDRHKEIREHFKILRTAHWANRFEIIQAMILMIEEESAKATQAFHATGTHMYQTVAPGMSAKKDYMEGTGWEVHGELLNTSRQHLTYLTNIYQTISWAMEITTAVNAEAAFLFKEAGEALQRDHLVIHRLRNAGVGLKNQLEVLSREAAQAKTEAAANGRSAYFLKLVEELKEKIGELEREVGTKDELIRSLRTKVGEGAADQEKTFLLFQENAVLKTTVQSLQGELEAAKKLAAVKEEVSGLLEGQKEEAIVKLQNDLRAATLANVSLEARAMQAEQSYKSALSREKFNKEQWEATTKNLESSREEQAKLRQQVKNVEENLRAARTLNVELSDEAARVKDQMEDEYSKRRADDLERHAQALRDQRKMFEAQIREKNEEANVLLVRMTERPSPAQRRNEPAKEAGPASPTRVLDMPTV